MAQCPNKVQYECITDIQLSRVLHVVSECAYAYLNQPHIWMNLMRFYDDRNLISDRDIRIIDDASKFRRGSPSKELLLRVAANSNQQLTLRDLLTDLYNLNLNEASRVLMEDLSRTHQSIQSNSDFNSDIVNHSISPNLADFRRHSVQQTDVYGSNYEQVYQQGQDEQPSSIRSLNNLSHPDKPYLYILRHPASKTSNEGESVILSCFAESNPASIHYQWYKNNKELVNECKKILILENVRPCDMGDYRCEVYCKEFALHETSKTATVHVILELPQILVQPRSHAAPLGSRISLSCEAVGSAGLSHQWYKNNNPLSNETSNTFVINKLSDDHCGKYYCKVSNNQGQVFSECATVTIRDTGYDSKSSSLDSEYSVHSATDKVALLMANEDYAHNPKLAAAANDVRALSHTLTNDLNFKTISLVNLNLEEMEQAVRLFCSHLINGAYCLIYIAGHGFENDGQCYIVPVDAPRQYKSSDCFSVRKLIKNIQKACNLSLTVILLDVCRKRNENIIALPEPHNGQAYQGNFVISFAAMESGMAYEIKGQKLSIYVTSLRKHLGKNKKITRILELVQMDIYKGSSTKGVQQPIFKSNIYEDRKLTDPVIPRNNLEQDMIRNDKWKECHEPTKPWLIYFESCATEVILQMSRDFSNTLTLTTSILNKGNSILLDFDLLVDPEQKLHIVDHIANIRQDECVIVIKHLQRINVQKLPITLRVKYCIGMDVFECCHNDHINLRFVDLWTSVQ